MSTTTLRLPMLYALLQLMPWAHGAVEGAERTHVSARGRIEPESGVVKVAAPYAFSAPQVITALQVKTGAPITRGQLLATLDSHPRLQAALAGARAEVALAESRLALAATRARAGEIAAAAAAAASAQIDFEHAERELKRSTQLDTQAAVARMDIDRWQTEVSAKKALVEKMRHSHAALRETLAAEARVSASAVALAKAAMRRAEAETAYGQVLAPCDGVVLKTLLRAGELASSPLLELGDTRTMTVIAEVYETDARFVKLGAKARITSPALAAPLTGEVISLGQRVSKRDAFNVDPTARTDGRIVEMKVRLDDPALVKAMTNLEVEVVIEATE
jgi:HlyD family secretion protein